MIEVIVYTVAWFHLLYSSLFFFFPLFHNLAILPRPYSIHADDAKNTH